MAAARPCYRLQGRAGDVPDGAAAPGDLLHEGGELVEGQVVRAAELEDLAAQAGIGDRQRGEGGDVGGGDEVDRVVAAPEHRDLPGSLQRTQVMDCLVRRNHCGIELFLESRRRLRRRVPATAPALP